VDHILGGGAEEEFLDPASATGTDHHQLGVDLSAVGDQCLPWRALAIDTHYRHPYILQKWLSRLPNDGSLLVGQIPGVDGDIVRKMEQGGAQVDGVEDVQIRPTQPRFVDGLCQSAEARFRAIYSHDDMFHGTSLA
jgi:hypothetical protein